MACSPEFTHSVYVDCDWSGVANDPCSTTGFYIFLVSSLISQKNKKQTAVSSSKAESQRRALANPTAELVRFRWLLVDLETIQSTVTPL